MDIKQQTQNVANQGRYGDSMLMHVNPAEVKGLASAMPITVNPQTGQPEAFLPFLAPLLGSALGGSLLTAGGLAGLSMSPALAAGLGAGLATYIESGGSGSKALLSGVTAGFGTNAANAAAQTAGTAAATTSNIAAGMTPELAAQTAQTAATAAPRAATGAYEALGDTFTGGFSGFDQGAKALASAAASPSGMLAGTALGARGIMESQEAFARQMGESEEEYKRRREEMYRNTPEPILYSAGGGRTGYYEGGDFGNFGPGDITGGNLPQIYAPAKRAYDVNPDFMAGFAPETMYFDPATISAPASSLAPNAPTIGIDSYQGSRGGYGGRQAAIAPQIAINPYEAYSGKAPRGLEFSREIPAPNPIMPVIPDIPITNPGDGVVDIPGGINIPNIGNIDFSDLDFQALMNQYENGEFDSKNILDQFNIPEKEIGVGAGFDEVNNNFVPITGDDLGLGENFNDLGFTPTVNLPEVNPALNINTGFTPNIDIPEITQAQIAQAQMAAPEVDLSQTNIPEVSIPQLAQNQINIPEVDASLMTESELALPQIDLSQINIPQTDASANQLGESIPNASPLSAEAIANLLGPQANVEDIFAPEFLQESVNNNLTDSSMLGGSMLGMSADALRAEGGTPQPSTGGGLFGGLIAQSQGATSPVAAPIAPPTGGTPIAPSVPLQNIAASGPTLAPASPVAPQLAPQLGPPSVDPTLMPAPDLTPKPRTPITAPGLPIPPPDLKPVAPVPVEPKEMITSPKEIEQIKQVIPQLPVQQLQQVIPQLPLETIQEVIPQLPPEIAQQVIPQLPSEVIEKLILPAPVSKQTPVAKTQAATPASMPELSPQLKRMMKPTERNFKPSLRGSRNRRAEGGVTGFQEGGMADINNDPLTQEVAMYIMGQSENEEVLSMFIEKYGNEAFMQLREMVLQSVVPDAQTEGLIEGSGNGGMDDDLRGMIGNKEQIAVSQDEFIVPADVVSMLGDGSSDAGSKELYDMMDRVRQEKTGTTTQAPKLANAGGLLPR